MPIGWLIWPFISANTYRKGESVRYINDIDIKGKRVLIRVDFNVPLDENLNITDDTRIRRVLPTINYALDEQAKIILASHMGRPNGKIVKQLSLAPVARRLQRLVNKEVGLAPDCVGEDVKKLIDRMEPGDIILLENLRFHIGEQKNDPGFARKLGKLCDVYINDGFAVVHRANASVVAITDYTKVCGAGFLMKDELNYFHRSLEDPTRPLVAVIGGLKISDKLGTLENLMTRVDKMMVGGAMANIFLKAVDYETGKSVTEDHLVEVARGLLRTAKKAGIKFFIPVDCVVADRFDAKAETMITTVQDVPKEWIIMDIGPATTTLYGEALLNAKTIIWNGPMGVFEMDAFSRGTYAMVHNIANSYALTIVGGGDTDVAVHRAGESSKISYISTGGGAFLELLEGKQLPGVKALERHSTGA